RARPAVHPTPFDGYVVRMGDDRAGLASQFLVQLPAATGYGLDLGVDIGGDGRQDLISLAAMSPGGNGYTLVFHLFRGAGPASGKRISGAFQRIMTTIPNDFGLASNSVRFAGLDGDGRQDVMVMLKPRTRTDARKCGTDNGLWYYRNTTVVAPSAPVQALQFDAGRLVACLDRKSTRLNSS